MIIMSSYQTCTARPPSHSTGELILKASFHSMKFILFQTLVYIESESPLIIFGRIPQQVEFESLKVLKISRR